MPHMLKSIIGAAGLDPKDVSNHSLRATSISRLYRASIPENVIMEGSGHLSTGGVRSYECTSVEQLKSVSEILSTTIPLPEKRRMKTPMKTSPKRQWNSSQNLLILHTVMVDYAHFIFRE